MRVEQKTLWVAAAVLMAFAPATLGDQLIKADGTKLDGRIVSEDKTVVVFEMSSGGVVMRQRIARTQVKSLQREVLEGPGYCALPISGQVGWRSRRMRCGGRSRPRIRRKRNM